MHDFIETIAILFSLALIVSPVVGYAVFSRYLKRKETAVLEKYGIMNKQEKLS
ncbi:MAG: hypothetical protein IAF02_06370 [Anaerolineae bacterium]|nr:hypothetical protein [Anaerolineae bacterium]